MEAGELRQSLGFYNVLKISDYYDDRDENKVLVKNCRAKLIRTNQKDYVNREFNSTSGKTELNFVTWYKYKHYISTDQQVLYRGEWYNVLDIDPDEQYRKELKLRLRLI